MTPRGVQVAWSAVMNDPCSRETCGRPSKHRFAPTFITSPHKWSCRRTCLFLVDGKEYFLLLHDQVSPFDSHLYTTVMGGCFSTRNPAVEQEQLKPTATNSRAGAAMTTTPTGELTFVEMGKRSKLNVIRSREE